MAVVEHVRLIERRLEALRSERDALTRQDDTRQALPHWAVDALVHAGMTRGEIKTFEAEPTAAVDDVESQRQRLDEAIEALEAELVLRSEDSLPNLQAIAEIAYQRLSRSIPQDPNDLFFDAGDAQTLKLVERLANGIRRFNSEPARQYG